MAPKNKWEADYDFKDIAKRRYGKWVEEDYPNDREAQLRALDRLAQDVEEDYRYAEGVKNNSAREIGKHGAQLAREGKLKRLGDFTDDVARGNRDILYGQDITDKLSRLATETALGELGLGGLDSRMRGDMVDMSTNLARRHALEQKKSKKKGK